MGSRNALLFLHECVKGTDLSVSVCDTLLTGLKDSIHSIQTSTPSYTTDSWCIYGRIIWSLCNRPDWSDALA